MNIEIKGLSYAYRKDRQVLSDTSFSLSSSDMAALLGKNGAGKSTLFKLMLKSLGNESGKIFIDGKDISMFKPKEIAKVFSYIPQSSHIEFSYSVLQTVLMGSASLLPAFSSPGKKEEEEAVRILDHFGLGKLRERSISSLSGGERQLVLISRALMQKSSFIILDEPTSNLDYGNQIMVLETLKDLNRSGIGIIYSTHSPELALNYSNKILTLQDGAVRTYSSADDLVSSNALHSLYDEDLYIAKVNTGKNWRYVCTPL